MHGKIIKLDINKAPINLIPKTITIEHIIEKIAEIKGSKYGKKQAKA
jgi:hypothetical protein